MDTIVKALSTLGLYNNNTRMLIALTVIIISVSLLLKAHRTYVTVIKFIGLSKSEDEDYVNLLNIAELVYRIKASSILFCVTLLTLF